MWVDNRMTPYIAYHVAGKLALSACKIGIIRDAKTANTRRYHYPPSAALSGTKPSATSARWSLLSSIATLFRRPGGRSPKSGGPSVAARPRATTANVVNFRVPC